MEHLSKVGGERGDQTNREAHTSRRLAQLGGGGREEAHSAGTPPGTPRAAPAR